MHWLCIQMSLHACVMCLLDWLLFPWTLSLIISKSRLIFPHGQDSLLFLYTIQYSSNCHNVFTFLFALFLSSSSLHSVIIHVENCHLICSGSSSCLKTVNFYVLVIFFFFFCISIFMLVYASTVCLS